MAVVAFPRSSGVLLHPTSLPGPYGVGDLGPEAYRWVDALAAAKQTWWQVLPLTPPGGGDSPYTAFSAFAGNVALLSPDLLVTDGLVAPDSPSRQHFGPDRVEYERVNPIKRAMVHEAWDRFRAGRGPGSIRDEFAAYVKQQASWLDDYALFLAIRDGLGGAPLTEWPADLCQRNPVALAALEKQQADEVGLHRFGQFLFDRQWKALRNYAADRRVKLIGDAPIFVSADSADVWAHREQFLFDAAGRPTAVAGVPPDYFSPTGQLWGNPLYDWSRMADTGYAWWVARIRRLLTQVDLVRLDHFRGFAAAWHVPPTEKTALKGKWVEGPGRKLFDKLTAELGSLPIIAEDLGLITDDVHELRLGLKLPGMAVLQFALGGPDSPHWPHNFDKLTVAYTGTHDNDTTNGWYAKLTDADRWTYGEYLGRAASQPSWELIRFAWGSSAMLAVAPMQDVLELGSEARMNVPGVAAGNWRWRMRPEHLRPDWVERLAKLTVQYNRMPKRD